MSKNSCYKGKVRKMIRIEGIRIKNFRTLKDVSLGRLFGDIETDPLSPLTVVIGKNGVGKTSLFDAFGFLYDCLRLGVEEASNARQRGGYMKLHTLNQQGPIEFEISYKDSSNPGTFSYQLSINLDSHSRPFVVSERFKQSKHDLTSKNTHSFLILKTGKGIAWKESYQGLDETQEAEKFDELLIQAQNETCSCATEIEIIELEDKRKLGLATLGALKQHPRISAFKNFMEDWHINYFTASAARSLFFEGPQKHLNMHGDNLGNIVQYMEREYPENFQQILFRIAQKIPGLESIDSEKTADGRLLLRFYEKGYQDPFYAQQMSDGTLKVFAYLVLLEDPSPPALLCLEEPENGLYHKLLETLAKELRSHATNKDVNSQLFITTHQPYFVDALDPKEVWILDKERDGFSKITRASDIEIVRNMVEEGLPLGSLWYSDYLDPR
jgi:predicted ATPase